MITQVAISISTKGDIDKAIAYNVGNKAYTQYYWADVIGPRAGVECFLGGRPSRGRRRQGIYEDPNSTGPMPDMAKGIAKEEMSR